MPLVAAKVTAWCVERGFVLWSFVSPNSSVLSDSACAWILALCFYRSRRYDLYNTCQSNSRKHTAKTICKHGFGAKLCCSRGAVSLERGPPVDGKLWLRRRLAVLYVNYF